MDSLALADLVDGRNEWSNIPDIIRETFKDFSVLVTQQAAQIRALDETIAILQKPRKRDERLVQLEHEVLEVSKLASRNRNSVETLQSRIASKVEGSEVHERLGEMKRSFEARLGQKADTVHVNTALASRVPLRLFEEQIEARVTHDQLAVTMDAGVRSKADAAQVTALAAEIASINRSKVNAEDLEEILNLALSDRVLTSDLAAIVADIRTNLDRKADAAQTAAELSSKADASVVERLAAEKGNAHQLLSLLEQKADIAYVNQELVGKADDAAVARALETKASRDEVEALLVAKVEASDVNDLLNKHLGQVSDAVAAYKRDVEMGLKSRATIRQVNEMFGQVSKDFNSLVLSLDLKLDRAEFVDSLEQREEALRAAVHDREIEVAHHTEAINVINTQLLQLSRDLGSKSDASTLNRALASFRKDLTDAVAEAKALVNEKASERMVVAGLSRKLERADVEEMLAGKADVADVAMELALKANVDDIDAMLSGKASGEAVIELSHMTQELRAALEVKANKADMAALVASKASIDEVSSMRAGIARVEKVLNGSGGSGRGGGSSGTLGASLTNLESDVTRLRQAFLELQADTQGKVDSHEFHSALAAKADITDVDAMLADTRDSLSSAIDYKASLGELQGLRSDTVELGNQLVTSTSEIQTLFSSSLDTLRGAVDALEAKVAHKVDDETLASHLGNVASVNEVSDLAASLRSLEAALKRKGDHGELMSLLHNKVDKAELAAAVDPLPTHAQLLDGLNAKADHADLVALKEFVNETKVDKSEWALDRHAAAAAGSGAGSGAGFGAASERAPLKPRNRDPLASLSSVSSVSKQQRQQQRQQQQRRGRVPPPRKSQLSLGVPPLVDQRTRTLGKAADTSAAMLGGASRGARGGEGDLLIQTSHRLHQVSGRPFQGLNTPSSTAGKGTPSSTASYSYILSSSQQQ